MEGLREGKVFWESLSELRANEEVVVPYFGFLGGFHSALSVLSHL